MRIVIDMQGAQNGSRYRGIGRYSLAFALELVRSRGSHQVVILLSNLFPDSVNELRPVFEQELGPEGVRVWSGIAPCSYFNQRNTWRRRTSELLREAFIESLAPDIVLVSSMIEGGIDNAVTSIGEFSHGIHTAAILYDLIPLLYKKEYLPDARARKWYFEKIEQLRKADLCLAISQSSCDEAVTHIGLARERVLNISAAVGPEFTAASYSPEELGKFQSRFGITRPFLLYAGAADPRKNIRRLIQAWALLPQAVRISHQLLLVGGMPVEQLSLKKYAQAQGIDSLEIIFAGRVNDGDLRTFYRLCRAFILPSLHEGFGLPALEAMTCGAPTIGSNCSSIPEVIGLPSALFDPRSPKDMADHISRALLDEDYRRLLIDNAQQRVAMFSWQHSAQMAWERFEQLAAEDPAAATQPKRSGQALVQDLVQAIARLPAKEIDNADLVVCAASLARLIPRPDARPNIFVDISELHRRDSGSGIQRAVRNLATCLLRLDAPTHATHLVYATESDPYRHARRFTQSLTQGDSSAPVIDDQVIDPRPGDIFLGLDLTDTIVIAHAIYFEHLRTLGVRVCFVVYDLLPITLPHFFPEAVCANHQEWLDIVASQDAVLCISRSTADEFTHWRKNRLGATARPIAVDWFHLGAEMAVPAPNSRLPSSATAVLAGLQARPSFLMVGTLEPRKGYAQALAAFETLWARGQDVNLVIVGQAGWMLEALLDQLRTHPALNQRLFWLEGIGDDYLEQVYAAATCLIAASEGEGFGLPLIEAAQHHLPILARDLPVFREVAGDHAYYFQGLEPAAMAFAINNWLTLYRQGSAPASEDIPWLTWAQSARQLFNHILPAKQNNGFK